MTNDSAGGLLAGVCYRWIILHSYVSIMHNKTVIKNGKTYKNILEAPVYGTASQKV